MDVLIDLLPSVNQVKISHAKKDKRQRNKYSRQMNNTARYNENVNDSNTILKKVLWAGPERRTSVERRQLKNKRGRWLESRDCKDRRSSESAISVKI